MSELFNEQKKIRYTNKIREIQKSFPPFTAEYFRNLSNMNYSVLTRYGYATDLKLFFSFLTGPSGKLCGKSIPSLSLDDMQGLNSEDIELFLDFISQYQNKTGEVINGENARSRKLAALRSFFKYYFKHGKLNSNVAALVDTPKLHEKAIIRLEPNEVAILLDHADSGQDLTERQKKYHANTRVRDMAILTLFLGTGIRISELVGIDIKDIDFDNNCFLITRKGGKQDILSFNEEVKSYLLEYYDLRRNLTAIEGNESAFFLSLQNKRITVRAVENIVKKYASSSVPLKKITPHKLRSTFGTMLYQESQDIYLVADVLGHKDVNTTKKHYAAQSRDNKRLAAKMIHLREE